jgi:hypothetical protein
MPAVFAILGAAFLTLIYWNLAEPAYKRANSRGLKAGQRVQLALLWAGFFVFMASLSGCSMVVGWLRLGSPG